MKIEDEEKWKILSENNHAYDGVFVYSVRTTGIFCKPSCSSKLPKRENVCYFDTPEQALNAGFRPCKRCRPDLIAYTPAKDIALRAKQIMDEAYAKSIATDFSQLGVTQNHLSLVFRKHFGMTIAEYQNTLRIKRAREALMHSRIPIIEIAYDCGFDSLSAFYNFFHKYENMTPGAFRKYAGKKENILYSEQEILQNRMFFETEIGKIGISDNGSAITRIDFANDIFIQNERNTPSPLGAWAIREIAEYFKGQRQTFTLPIAPAGTAFQKSVWKALLEIPYGQTRSYRQVAEMVGNYKASRAVGMANNKNPIPIIIPCHRVIGADGSLVGYAGGMEIKVHLLNLEKDAIKAI